MNRIDVVRKYGDVAMIRARKVDSLSFRASQEASLRIHETSKIMHKASEIDQGSHARPSSRMSTLSRWSLRRVRRRSVRSHFGKLNQSLALQNGEYFRDSAQNGHIEESATGKEEPFLVKRSVPSRSPLQIDNIDL